MKTTRSAKVAILVTDGFEPVVVDGNLITGRKPDEIPTFNSHIPRALGVRNSRQN